MEVHAHTHTPRKKWTHYFWEFLMLFLAVFCGFLAENQREHYVEHQREKQYVQSLYRDIKQDTAFNTHFKSILIRSNKRLDSIILMIGTGAYKADASLFYRLSLSARAIYFYEYHNSTYEQLKNSGNLRLLRAPGLADSLTNYNSGIQELLRQQEDRLKLATSNIAAMMWEVLDAGYFKERMGHFGNDMPGGYIPDNPVFGKVDELKMQKYKNLCFERKLILPAYYNFVESSNNKATTLLKLLKEKYHLK